MGIDTLGVLRNVADGVRNLKAKPEKVSDFFEKSKNSISV